MRHLRRLLLIVGCEAVGATQIQAQSLAPSGQVTVDEVKVVWSEVGLVVLLAAGESMIPHFCGSDGGGVNAEGR